MKIMLSLAIAAVFAIGDRDVSAQTATTKPVGFFGFPFPPGVDLVGQTEASGMKWAAAGPAGPPISIALNNLTVPGLVPPMGNRARLAGANGPAARIGLGTNTSTGTLYYSLALRVVDLGTLGTSGGTLAAFNNATGASTTLPAPLAARLLVRSTAGGYQLGLSKSSANAQDFAWAPATFGTTDVVFAVAACEFNGEQGTMARLWVNPNTVSFGRSSAPAPTLSTSTGPDMDPIESFALIQRPQPILPAVTFVDEVRVGTTWASVTPVDERPSPDLKVVLGPVPSQIQEGDLMSITATVSNAGPGIASGIVFINPIPIGIAFVSATASQGSCSNSASGVQCALGSLQPGGTATVSVVGIPDFNQLATARNVPEMQESIDVTNTVTVTATEADAAPADNSVAVPLVVVPLRDFPDAPTPPYPTLLPTAARHRVGALRFGVLVDAEPNGQPVNLDDALGVPDEVTDGFGLPAGFYAGGYSPITIMVSGPASFIDLWIDLDGAPGWGAIDHVLPAVPHPGGGAVVGYAIPIPLGAMTGLTWARARVHRNPAGLPTTGYGGSGEVVDFQVNILPAVVDLVAGMTPASIEVTEGDPLTLTATVSNAGPSTATSVQLRLSIPTGTMLQSASNDHGSCTVQGSNVICSVNTLAAQQCFKVQLSFGVDSQFTTPIDANDFFDVNIEVSVTAAEADLHPLNNVAVAAFIVFPNLDFGDARIGYAVTRAENGARHRNGAVFHLGPAFDREPNGAHSPNADFDDLVGIPDDEDGVVIPGPLVAGHTHPVTVTVPVPGFLDAFFDWNNDGDWVDPGERVTPPGGLLVVGPGAIPVLVTVPIGAINGSPHARFRFSDLGGLGPTGFHSIGEVEDYPFEVRRIDFGDAPDVTYQTYLASGGPNHIIVAGEQLGLTVDAEPDGQPWIWTVATKTVSPSRPRSCQAPLPTSR